MLISAPSEKIIRYSTPIGIASLLLLSHPSSLRGQWLLTHRESCQSKPARKISKYILILKMIYIFVFQHVGKLWIVVEVNIAIRLDSLLCETEYALLNDWILAFCEIITYPTLKFVRK